MDDCVLIHSDKKYLAECLEAMTEYIHGIGLEFNAKTQVFPIRNGVNYLGWHLYLSDSGKVIRKVTRQTKYRYKRKLRSMQQKYKTGEVTLAEIKQVISSYHAHLEFGHTYRLQEKVLGEFVLTRAENT